MDSMRCVCVFISALASIPIFPEDIWELHRKTEGESRHFFVFFFCGNDGGDLFGSLPVRGL